MRKLNKGHISKMYLTSQSEGTNKHWLSSVLICQMDAIAGKSNYVKEHVLQQMPLSICLYTEILFVSFLIKTKQKKKKQYTLLHNYSVNSLQHKTHA